MRKNSDYRIRTCRTGCSVRIDRAREKVTVVEMAEQILPVQLDAHAAKTYQELFEQAGVQFYLGCKAEGAVCEADGMIRAVTLDTGKQLLCDLIIVAAGVRPAVGFLEKVRSRSNEESK